MIRLTNRERMLNLLHYKSVDRLPAIHFGYWNELLDEWADKGIISHDIARGWGDGNECDRELDKILGWDCNWSHTFRYSPKLFPAFNKKVIETLPDGTQRVQNSNGIIEKIVPGVTSIPSEDDYLLKTRKDFEELFLPKMQFSLDRIDFDKLKEFNKNRDPELMYGI